MYEAPSLHFQTAKNSIKNHPSTKCKQVAHSKRLGNLCSLPQEHIQKISEKSSGTFASSTPLMFGFAIIFEMFEVYNKCEFTNNIGELFMRVQRYLVIMPMT